MPEVSPFESAGLHLLAAGNDRVKRALNDIIARQPKSIALHRRAMEVLSATSSVVPYGSPMLPLYFDRASGARVVDVDGHEYVDGDLGFGSMLLGHAPAEVAEALQRALARGLQASLGFPEQLELAELVLEMVPGVDRVAYFHSGTEAVSGAVRLARAATGRRRVAKFEGCYHGANAVGLHNTKMILQGQEPTDPIDAIVPRAASSGVKTSDEFLILPFNSSVALDRIRAHHKELACVVVDPIPPFMSNWPDVARRFIVELHAVTSELKVPLVFDEVLSGFRMSRGGAREWAGVTPQMSCFGKVTSAMGLPLSIVAGDARFLDRARTNGLFRDYFPVKAWVTTTFSAGFPAVCAALAQLRHLNSHYDVVMGRIDAGYAQLAGTLADVKTRTGIDVTLQGHPRLQVYLAVAKGEPTEQSYRGMMATTSPAHLRTLLLLHLYLREHGLYTKGAPTMNLSAAHGPQEIALAASAIEAALVRIRDDGALVGTL